jgi:hypothetical protein
VAYLGHAISADGITMDEQKDRAVLDWTLPRSVRTVRAFLGLVGYYRCFIKNYGAIATPLMALLKKDTFKWSAGAKEAFRALQRALTTVPILQLECDAFGTGFLQPPTGAAAYQARRLRAGTHQVGTYGGVRSSSRPITSA